MAVFNSGHFEVILRSFCRGSLLLWRCLVPGRGHFGVGGCGGVVCDGCDGSCCLVFSGVAVALFFLASLLDAYLFLCLVVLV